MSETVEQSDTMNGSDEMMSGQDNINSTVIETHAPKGISSLSGRSYRSCISIGGPRYRRAPDPRVSFHSIELTRQESLTDLSELRKAAPHASSTFLPPVAHRQSSRILTIDGTQQSQSSTELEIEHDYDNVNKAASDCELFNGRSQASFSRSSFQYLPHSRHGLRAADSRTMPMTHYESEEESTQSSDYDDDVLVHSSTGIHGEGFNTEDNFQRIEPSLITNHVVDAGMLLSLDSGTCIDDSGKPEQQESKECYVDSDELLQQDNKQLGQKSAAERESLRQSFIQKDGNLHTFQPTEFDSKATQLSQARGNRSDDFDSWRGSLDASVLPPVSTSSPSEAIPSLASANKAYTFDGGAKHAAYEDHFNTSSYSHWLSDNRRDTGIYSPDHSSVSSMEGVKKKDSKVHFNDNVRVETFRKGSPSLVLHDKLEQRKADSTKQKLNASTEVAVNQFMAKTDGSEIYHDFTPKEAAALSKSGQRTLKEIPLKSPSQTVKGYLIDVQKQREIESNQILKTLPYEIYNETVAAYPVHPESTTRDTYLRDSAISDMSELPKQQEHMDPKSSVSPTGTHNNVTPSSQLTQAYSRKQMKAKTRCPPMTTTSNMSQRQRSEILDGIHEEIPVESSIQSTSVDTGDDNESVPEAGDEMTYSTPSELLWECLRRERDRAIKPATSDHLPSVSGVDTGSPSRSDHRNNYELINVKHLISSPVRGHTTQISKYSSFENIVTSNSAQSDVLDTPSPSKLLETYTKHWSDGKLRSPTTSGTSPSGVSKVCHDYSKESKFASFKDTDIPLPSETLVKAASSGLLHGPTPSELLSLYEKWQAERLVKPASSDILHGPTASELFILYEKCKKESLVSPATSDILYSPRPSQLLTLYENQNRSWEVDTVDSHVLKRPSPSPVRENYAKHVKEDAIKSIDSMIYNSYAKNNTTAMANRGLSSESIYPASSMTTYQRTSEDILSEIEADRGLSVLSGQATASQSENDDKYLKTDPVVQAKPVHDKSPSIQLKRAALSEEFLQRVLASLEEVAEKGNTSVYSGILDCFLDPELALKVQSCHTSLSDPGLASVANESDAYLVDQGSTSSAEKESTFGTFDRRPSEKHTTSNKHVVSHGNRELSGSNVINSQVPQISSGNDSIEKQDTGRAAPLGTSRRQHHPLAYSTLTSVLQPEEELLMFINLYNKNLGNPSESNQSTSLEQQNVENPDQEELLFYTDLLKKTLWNNREKKIPTSIADPTRMHDFSHDKSCKHLEEDNDVVSDHLLNMKTNQSNGEMNPCLEQTRALDTLPKHGMDKSEILKQPSYGRDATLLQNLHTQELAEAVSQQLGSLFREPQSYSECSDIEQTVNRPVVDEAKKPHKKFMENLTTTMNPAYSDESQINSLEDCSKLSQGVEKSVIIGVSACSDYQSSRRINRLSPQRIDHLSPQRSDHPHCIDRPSPQRINLAPLQRSDQSSERSDHPHHINHPSQRIDRPSPQRIDRVPLQCSDYSAPQQIGNPHHIDHPPHRIDHPSPHRIDHPSPHRIDHPSQCIECPAPQRIDHAPLQCNDHEFPKESDHESPEHIKRPSPQRIDRAPLQHSDGTSHQDSERTFQRSDHAPLLHPSQGPDHAPHGSVQLDQGAFNDFFLSVYQSQPDLLTKVIQSNLPAPGAATSEISSVTEQYSQTVDVSTLTKHWSPPSISGYESNSSYGQSEYKNILLDKHELEQDHQRLVTENKNLQNQVKTLHDHLTQATDKVSDLEKTLSMSKKETVSVKEHMMSEIMESNKKMQGELERDREEMHKRVLLLTQDNDSLRTEVLSMESQLDSAVKARHQSQKPMDKAKIVDTLRHEIESMNSELESVKKLLHQSESQVKRLESDQSASLKQIHELSQVRDMLHQQLLGSAGTSAMDLEMQTLEHRLQMTEERLYLERADRGNSLSKVEEKLIHDNAKLQTAEKELTRQLQREKDRMVHMEAKISEAKDEIHKLRLAVPITDPSLGPGMSSDMASNIYTALRFDTNKNLREERCKSENNLQKAHDKIEDLAKERDTLETVYQEQLSHLVKEHHDSLARIKTMEDRIDVLHTENASLREYSGTNSITNVNANSDKKTTFEKEIEKLSFHKQNLEGELAIMQRTIQLQEGEISTLRTKVESREQALDGALVEIEKLSGQVADEGMCKRKEERINKLMHEMHCLQSELSHTYTQNDQLRTDLYQLEQELDMCQRQLDIHQNKLTEASTDVDNQISTLKSQLQRRDAELSTLKTEKYRNDTELNRARHHLVNEQDQLTMLEAQLGRMQTDLVQKQGLLNTLSGSSQEAGVQAMKDMMESLTQELNKSQATARRLQVDLNNEQDKTIRLERELRSPRSDTTSPRDSLSLNNSAILELTVKEMELRLEKLQHDLSQAVASAEKSADEYHALQIQFTQLKQELSRERAQMCQVTAEKSDAEKQLQFFLDERDGQFEARVHTEEDLVKLQSKLTQVIMAFESGLDEQFSTFANGQVNVKDVEELQTLIDAKTAMIQTHEDTISRQQRELAFVQNRISFVQEENDSQREVLARMTEQLNEKMNESVATMDLNQLLLHEHARLQKDVERLEQDCQKDQEFHLRRSKDVEEFIGKLEKVEEASQGKDVVIAQLEQKMTTGDMEKRDAQRLISQLETDNAQLTIKIKQLTEDLTNANSVKKTLENQLQKQTTLLSRDKGQLLKQRDDITATSQKLGLVTQEKTMLSNSLEAERVAVEKLKEDVQHKEEAMHKLREQVNALKMECESNKMQMNASRETIEQMKRDKANIYKEFQEMCRQVHHRDEVVSSAKEKFSQSMEEMQREFTDERLKIEKEKVTTEKELELAKHEVQHLQDSIKQKDVQLSAFSRTLHEMDAIDRQKHELEEKVKLLSYECHESKILIGSHRTEVVALRATNQQLQEDMENLQSTYKSLQSNSDVQKSADVENIQNLKDKIATLKSNFETEKFELKQILSKTQVELQATEKGLCTMVQTRDELKTSTQTYESSLSDVKAQLLQETTMVKVAKEESARLRAGIHDMTEKQVSLEEKYGKLLAAKGKADLELKTEKETSKKLLMESSELEANAYMYESSSKAKDEQIDMLQGELSKLKLYLDTQKQQLQSKVKRTSLELKQQGEVHDHARMQLLAHNERLSMELEKARNNVTEQNRENLKLQEEILTLEEKVREGSSQLSQARDSLKMEEQIQNTLTLRNNEQEEEVKRLRMFLSKKAEEEGDGDGKGSWKDLNRIVHNLSQQLQQQFTASQKSPADDGKIVKKYKKQMTEMESQLSTEKALHQITRTSLLATEEDCHRLRQQLLRSGRNGHHRANSADTDRSSKSRMERINEIIARSQTQAQAMLSTGHSSPSSPLHSKFDCDSNANSSLNCSFNSTSTGPIFPSFLLPSPSLSRGQQRPSSADRIYTPIKL